MHAVHCTHAVQCTLRHCTLHTAQYTIYDVNCTLHTEPARCTQQNARCTQQTARCTQQTGPLAGPLQTDYGAGDATAGPASHCTLLHCTGRASFLMDFNSVFILEFYQSFVLFLICMSVFVFAMAFACKAKPWP